MKKIFSFMAILSFLVTASTAMGLEKRYFYDLFGESLGAPYRLMWLTDVNGLTQGSSILQGKGWGFVDEQNYLLNYSDNLGKMKAKFKFGAFYGAADGSVNNDLFDVSLTPFTFQRVWFPGFVGTLTTEKHSGTLLFSRTSGMNVDDVAYPEATYLMAFMDEYKLSWDRVDLVVGGTYLHHWKDNGYIDQASYFGNIASDTPTSITLRFSDDSPQDGYGARLYSMSCLIDGKEYPVTVNAPYEEANGANSFEKTTPVLIPGNAKSVKIIMVVANDYRVEVKTDKVVSYSIILRSPGNIQDESNKKTILYTYGLSTASDMLGLTARGNVYGVEVEAECVFNNQYRKYPSAFAERTYDMYPVAYIKASRAIDFTGNEFVDNKLVIGGDYFYTHPSFSSPSWDYSNSFGETSAFTYVDDNDDKDWYVDGTGLAGSGSTYCDPTPQFLPYDRDSNYNPGQPTLDWEQDIFLFSADPPRFETGRDRNNNGMADEYEDDLYPDYPYRLDRQGFGLFGKYNLTDGMDFEGGYDYFTEAFGTRKTINVYLDSMYQTSVSDFGDFTLHHILKRAWDDIPDDQNEIRDEQNAVYVGADPLSFEDSLLNIFYAESIFSGIKGLTVSNRFKIDNNYQYVDARNIRWAGFITGVLYEYRPSQRLTIAPQWKCWLENGASMPSYALYASDKQVNAFALKFIYKLFDKTTVTGAAQYKIVNLPLDTLNEYNGWTFVAQLHSKYGEFPLLIGYERKMRFYVNDATKNVKEETMFLKVYSTGLHEDR